MTLTSEPGGSSFSGAANELIQTQAKSDRLTVKHWAGSSREFIELIGHGAAVKEINFHLIEAWIITNSRDNIVRYWNLKEGGKFRG